MRRFSRLLIVLVVFFSGTVLVPYAALPSEPFNWQALAGAYTPSANLVIQKVDSPDPVRLGEALTYTITVINRGPSRATNVILTDDLPSSVELESVMTDRGVCTVADPVVCELGPMGRGAKATVTVVVIPTEGGLITNTASVGADQADAVASNNEVSQTTAVDTCQARVLSAPDTIYDNVQDALDAAGEEDVVEVAGYCAGVRTYDDGTRTTLKQTAIVTRPVTIEGGFNPEDWDDRDAELFPTTLDARELGRALVISGTITATVDSLELTSGKADAGGGLYVIDAQATISNCVIFGNRSTGTRFTQGGGGVYLSSSASQLINNRILENQAVRGGGVYVQTTKGALLEGNIIRENNASRYGGGIYTNNSDVTYVDNVIQENKSLINGGGLAVRGTLPDLTMNDVSDNISGRNNRGTEVWKTDL
ncbi:MAG: right-handed parallel beta-helix repeat-containing protein [Anaerolineae bacterium]